MLPSSLTRSEDGGVIVLESFSSGVTLPSSLICPEEYTLGGIGLILNSTLSTANSSDENQGTTTSGGVPGGVQGVSASALHTSDGGVPRDVHGDTSVVVLRPLRPIAGDR
jgi:hypothetical protein